MSKGAAWRCGHGTKACVEGVADVGAASPSKRVKSVKLFVWSLIAMSRDWLSVRIFSGRQSL